ncbi:hypothetical protein RG836_13320 [Pseudomonas sp. SZMC_28357]|nr:hypothetical protein [Pseudomonas sp. SZMC_28357]MDR9752431.1 hypothetical protein [Pseudomonas sp. SZMC_28357]
MKTAEARQYACATPLDPEVPMAKMTLFLFGFLVLTIGIGVLATIPPG